MLGLQAGLSRFFGVQKNIISLAGTRVARNWEATIDGRPEVIIVRVEEPRLLQDDMRFNDRQDITNIISSGASHLAWAWLAPDGGLGKWVLIEIAVFGPWWQANSPVARDLSSCVALPLAEIPEMAIIATNETIDAMPAVPAVPPTKMTAWQGFLSSLDADDPDIKSWLAGVGSSITREGGSRIIGVPSATDVAIGDHYSDKILAHLSVFSPATAEVKFRVET